MFKVIILICATSVQPNDCQPQTALTVLHGPDANNEIACGMQSQAYLANSAIGRDLSKDEYIKIMCVRTDIGKNNVG